MKQLWELEHELKEVDQDIATALTMSRSAQHILMDGLEARKMEIEAQIMEILIRNHM